MDSAGSLVRFLDPQQGTLSAAALQRASSRGSSSAGESGNAMFDAVSTASSHNFSSASSDALSSSGLPIYDARSSASSYFSGTSGGSIYESAPSAFRNALHRLSSSATTVSSGSGTEWFEAGDADSNVPSRSGSFLRAEESPQPEEAPVGKRLDLALFQAVDSSAASMLGRAEDASARAQDSPCALLEVRDVAGKTTAAGDLGAVMLRIFTEVCLT